MGSEDNSKSFNWIATILVVLLALIIGGTIGYLYRENQAQDAATDAINTGQQNIQNQLNTLNSNLSNTDSSDTNATPTPTPTPPTSESTEDSQTTKPSNSTDTQQDPTTTNP